MGCDKRFGEEYQEWIRIEDINWEATTGSLWQVYTSWFGDWLFQYIHMLYICTYTYICITTCTQISTSWTFNICLLYWRQILLQYKRTSTRKMECLWRMKGIEIECSFYLISHIQSIVNLTDFYLQYIF